MTKNEILNALKTATTKAERIKLAAQYTGHKPIEIRELCKVTWQETDKYLAKLALQKDTAAFNTKLNVEYSAAKFSKLRAKAHQILAKFRTGYTMGDLKTIRINAGVYSFVNSTCHNYAKSCCYRATHGSVVIDLSLAELKKAKIVDDEVFLTPKIKLCGIGKFGKFSVEKVKI